MLSDCLLFGAAIVVAAASLCRNWRRRKDRKYFSFALFNQRPLPIFSAKLLFFFQNAPQTLPNEISRFENLSTIEADNNELSSLPSVLASMPIYRLSLRRNSLSSSAIVDEFLAPSSMAPPGSLPLSISIRELDLSSNDLSEVPTSVFACRGLQVGVHVLSGSWRL